MARSKGYPISIKYPLDVLSGAIFLLLTGDQWRCLVDFSLLIEFYSNIFIKYVFSFFARFFVFHTLEISETNHFIQIIFSVSQLGVTLFCNWIAQNENVFMGWPSRLFCLPLELLIKLDTVKEFFIEFIYFN